MFKPTFTITTEINSRIAEIEKLNSAFNHTTILPELEVQLRFRATVESIYSSTSIEGNPLNKQEVEKTVSGKHITASDYAIREVLNYKNALDWINRQENNKHLTNKNILHLHKLAMKDLLPQKKVGLWRKGPIYIIDEINGKEIVQYQGPDAQLLPSLVSTFLKWIALQQKTALHPVLLAGLIHYIFVSIHPFADGNGRTTRLLTTNYLKNIKYDFRGSLSLDSFYLSNRQEYYQKLSLADNFDGRMQADLTPFLDFFTKGFLHSTQDLNQYIMLNTKISDKKKPIRLNKDEMAVLEYVHQFQSINLGEAEKILRIPRRTVQRRLAKLVEFDLLEKRGQGPNTIYVRG